MNRVTITLTIDLPDGVTPSVDYAAVPPAVVADALRLLTPAAQEEPPHVAEQFPPFAKPAEVWPVGDCPKHHRPWKDGKFGPFCSAKDESQQPKGYCVLKPGDIWGGKNIPLLVA